MNFAPYQDESPETERALSPPLAERSSKSPPAQSYSPSSLPPPSHFGGRDINNGGSAGGFGGGPGGGFSGRDLEGGGRLSLSAFETSLPIRMDFEAMLAYLLLPPAGGVLLLLLEHKSDYVR